MNYTKEELSLTNLHDLRNLARKIGVRAPSGINKTDLINQIIEIQSGNKEPYVPSGAGRPIKYRLDDNDSIDENFAILNYLNKKGKLKKIIKQEIIASIVKEIEKKLYEIL